jgi:hypothetical protein
VHLLDATQVKVGEVNVYPGRGNYATTLWRPGDLLREVYWVPVREQITQPAMGRVKVAFFLADDTQAHLAVTDAQGTDLGGAVTFGRFKLAPAVSSEVPLMGEVGLATFGGPGSEGERFVRLTRAEWGTDQMHLLAGGVFTVTLTWDALGRPPADYQVFLHVDGPDGPLAFGDGPPQGGAYPTGLWEGGERIVDARAVWLPPDMRAGTYPLVAGLYDATGQRVPACGPDGQRLAADQVVLGRLEVLRQDYQNFVPLFARGPLSEEP